MIPLSAQANSAFVMADGAGDNAAGNLAHRAWLVHSCGKTEVFAANCSHLGCAVDFNPSSGHFECPCHGSMYSRSCAGGHSQFGIDGSVFHGPALHPLAHIHWKAGPDPDEILLDGKTFPI